MELGDGVVLAVRRENLELLEAQAPSGFMEGTQRTLTRDNAMLVEFDGNPDPDCLVLYYHIKDGAFDAFSAGEYHTQMLRYFDAGIPVVAVVPRRIRQDDYLLVCLRDNQEDRNTLCTLAFNCLRQFAGISMLVKRRCFVCHKPGAPTCTCQVACFCSKDCKKEGWDAHKKLCQLVRRSPVATEEECVAIC